ncbi:hypothetical protein [Streptomyces sp. NPDC097619]|uniref:hypothetical protein n=1 Tax=Streptomyces sp. NPDC097619 TaxID=3157228 RepID=UPI0033319A1C
MTSPGFDHTYLLPLFQELESRREQGAYQPLSDPAPSSSLHVDEEPLGTYSASFLIRNSYGAGIAHADALRRLVHAGEVDPFSPWTLMRGALENFAMGVWLLDGPGRAERRRRTLALWYEDMRNRANHEVASGHEPGPEGKTGRERRGQIADLATSLGIDPGSLSKPQAGLTIKEAAQSAGLKPTSVDAAWQAASGFAHGRYWTNLRASAPVAARQSSPDTYSIAFVLDEGRHRPLVQYTHTLLRHLRTRYEARAEPR